MLAEWQARSRRQAGRGAAAATREAQRRSPVCRRCLTPHAALGVSRRWLPRLQAGSPRWAPQPRLGTPGAADGQTHGGAAAVRPRCCAATADQGQAGNSLNPKPLRLPCARRSSPRTRQPHPASGRAGRRPVAWRRAEPLPSRHGPPAGLQSRDPSAGLNPSAGVDHATPHAAH